MTVDSVRYVHVNNDLIVSPNLCSKVNRFLTKVPKAMKRSMWCAVDRQGCRFMEFNHALKCYLHVIIEDHGVHVASKQLDQPLLPEENAQDVLEPIDYLVKRLISSTLDIKALKNENKDNVVAE